MRPFVIRDALVVDADADLKDLLLSVLKPGIWAIQHVPTNQAALLATHGKPFELIITSERTSGGEDVELLRKILVGRPHTRLIILANEGTPRDVLASMRAHAFSFFSKPYSLEQLGNMIQLATEAPFWDDGIELESSTPEWIRLRVRCRLHPSVSPSLSHHPRAMASRAHAGKRLEGRAAQSHDKRVGRSINQCERAGKTARSSQA